MAFPSIHYGSFGDEKVTSSTKIGGLPLGIKMELPDGRQFRHSRIGGTAAVAGKLYESGSSISASDTMFAKSLVLGGTISAGNTTVTMTAGATTAPTTNQFQDGILATAGTVGGGLGYTYKIKSSASAAAGSSFTVTLYETDPVKVSMSVGTTLVGLRENPYTGAKLTTGDTAGAGKIIGVACNSAAASAYVWLQTKGEAPVFTGGTVLIVGESVVASTAVAGAAVPRVASTAGITSDKADRGLGICLQSAATAGYAIVDLNIN